MKYKDDRVAIYAASKHTKLDTQKLVPEIKTIHSYTFCYRLRLLMILNMNLFVLGEGRAEVKKVTYAELHQTVAEYAAAMKQMGIKVNDRVVGVLITKCLFYHICKYRTQVCSKYITFCLTLPGYIPNGVEAVAAMLAAASIGAIWSSTSPEFGVAVSCIKLNVIVIIYQVLFNLLSNFFHAMSMYDFR